jgi:hypothetical protein
LAAAARSVAICLVLLSWAVCSWVTLALGGGKGPLARGDFVLHRRDRDLRLGTSFGGLGLGFGDLFQNAFEGRLELFLRTVGIQLQRIRRCAHQHLFADGKFLPDFQLELEFGLIHH